MRKFPPVAPFALMAGLLVAAGCATIFGGKTAGLAVKKSATNLAVHVIDVGQGNCVLVECPGADPVMDDCGTTSLGVLTEKEIHDYVAGIIGNYVTLSDPSPLTLFVSHSDEDHLNMIYDPVNGIDPATVGTIYVSERGSDYPAAFSDWAAKTAAFKAGHYYHFDGTGPYANKAPCGKASVDVIAVNAKYGKPGQNPNADSIVLRVTYGKFSTIFTGDAEGSTEDLAIANVGTKGVDTTVLLGSHHGADTNRSNSLAWTKTTDPKILIFSAGHNDGFGHPRCTVIQRYLDNSPNLVDMDASLAMACGQGGSTWGSINTDKGVLSTWMNDSILVNVADTGNFTVTCDRNDTHCDMK